MLCSYLMYCYRDSKNVVAESSQNEIKKGIITDLELLPLNSIVEEEEGL